MGSWDNPIASILRMPFHKDMRVEKSAVCHPIADGFVKSIGDFQGQIADYRKRLEDGRSIHVREYPSCFLIHWDKVDPSDPIGHLVEDAPHWILIGILGLAVFAGIGLCLRESKESS